MTATVPVPPDSPTREALLDSAERRFGESGFAGASVRDIATDAGLRNQASLYHYFPGKQQLYEAVIARGVDALLPLWGPNRATNGVPTASTLDALLDYLAAHPYLARLLERAGIDDDPEARGAIRLLQPLYAAGVDALRDVSGRWQPDELPHLAAGIYHLIFGYFANASLIQAVVGEDPQSASMLARQRRFVLSAIALLLVRAPAPPPTPTPTT